MDYTYKDIEIEYARYIKTYPPYKIWWDFTSYVFDYQQFYFKIESVPEKADTQNKSDEAIIGQFTKYFERFVPGKNAVLVCQEKKIEELYIVRTFLYFTTFRAFSRSERFFNQAKQMIKRLVTGKEDPFGNLLAETIGSCEEITCHPKAEEAKKVDPKYANLIDCGLLIRIDGRYIKAFVESNGFGFIVWDENYFCDIGEIMDLAGQYEFINVPVSLPL